MCSAPALGQDPHGIYLSTSFLTQQAQFAQTCSDDHLSSSSPPKISTQHLIINAKRM